MNTNSNFKIILFLFSLFLILSSCGAGEKLKNIRKPVDLAKTPLDPDERARKNIEEGRGISIGSAFGGNRNTNYEFSTSNPMWRASLETLDFLPLTTVDYSGGIIITDWYYDSSGSSDESIKIAIRFLSNDIRSESLKVTVHQRICKASNNCKIKLLNNSNIQEELHRTILKKASLMDKDKKDKKK